MTRRWPRLQLSYTKSNLGKYTDDPQRIRWGRVGLGVVVFIVILLLPIAWLVYAITQYLETIPFYYLLTPFWRGLTLFALRLLCATVYLAVLYILLRIFGVLRRCWKERRRW